MDYTTPSIMAYTYGREMDLVEYFNMNKNLLPQLCIITGGIYGETRFDDFASDQVMRFQRYIRQIRVKMKRTGTNQYISVPLETKLKFKVIKGRNNIGPEEDLKTIMQNNSLPVLLDIVPDFPRDVFGPIARQYIQLLATEETSECYLQGFCVTDEVINVGGVATIIVIPDITVAIIDGFTDRPKDKFQEHVRIMEELVKKSTAKFDDLDVDMDIRILEKKEQQKEDHDSDNEYDYIEPPPLPKPRATDERQLKNSASHGVLNNNEPPALLKPRSESSSSEDKPPLTTVSKRPLPTLPHLPFVEYQPSSSVSNTLSPTSAKATETGQVKKNKPYENDRVQTVNPTVKQETPESLYEPDIYGDDVRVVLDTEASRTFTASDFHENQPAQSTTESDMETKKYDISGKNVEEIIDILGQLKLIKYSEMFEDDMIDGMTLKEFSVEDLKREYGMRHVEAIRLVNFVQHGHIPK